MAKTRINLTVNGDTWELFKSEVGKGNASTEIQRYMEMVIDQGLSRNEDELKEQLNRLEEKEEEILEQLNEKQQRLEKIRSQKRQLEAKKEAEDDKFMEVEVAEPAAQ